MDIINQAKGLFLSNGLLAVLGYCQTLVLNEGKRKIDCGWRMKRSHRFRFGTVLWILAVCMMAFQGNAWALRVGNETGTSPTYVITGTADDDGMMQNTAVGADSTASTGWTGAPSTATGAYSEATGDGSTATGAYSQASGAYSTATGIWSQASGFGSTATGGELKHVPLSRRRAGKNYTGRR